VKEDQIKVKDKCGREIDYLRISLTDACNLRCIYCMSEKDVKFNNVEGALTNRELEKQSNFETYKRLEMIIEEKVEFGDGHILVSSSNSIIHNLLIKRISRKLY